MQQNAKLVTCQDLNGQKLQFVVLKDKELGRGAYGKVNMAYDQSCEYEELAVKIIPYGDEKTKETIKKEIEILKNLPNHPNLVKVKPLKCFSQKNFYIFMEYCNQGTLTTQMRAKATNEETFTEEEIFRAFYQILSGYEVLWKMKILHQDLKPDNILVKNGSYKITDFGFSIFYQGVRMDSSRFGTCEYMPLEKITKADYFASTKSDVYALGVIFFKMITGKHPYVLRKFSDHKEYAKLLRKSQLNVPERIKSRISIPMQELFDLIIGMVAKEEKDRIDFDEVYRFITEQESFLQFIEVQRKSQQFHSVEISVPKKPTIKFVEVSKAFMIPFSVPRAQEDQYYKLLKDTHVKSEERQKLETANKVERYLCSMRIMVYFFDRLTRRLIIQKRKKQLQNKKNDQVTQVEQNALLSLTYAATKLSTLTLQDARYQRVFTKQEWTVYKLSRQHVLKLIQKDEEYLKDLTNQILLETKQSTIKDRHRIIESSKKQLMEFLSGQVRGLLMQLLMSRVSWMPVDQKQFMVTIYFILNAIDVIDNFKERHERWEQLEGIFRKMESEELNELRGKVTQRLQQLGIIYSLDEGEWDQHSQQQQ